MRLPIRYQLTSIFFVSLVCCGPTDAWGQKPVGTDAAGFAGELLRKHSYLLGESQRTALDEINRQLRQARQQAAKSGDDANKQRALKSAAVAQKKLIELLKTLSNVLSASLEDGQVKGLGPDPHELPGDVGAVLFRIQSGDGPVRLVAYDVDLSEKSGEIDIDCAPAGTTWALVGLNHVPADRTSLRFEFNRAGMASIETVLDVTTPESGQLKVTILSADTHESAPAMVRLVWKTNGVDRKPSTAIEFAPLFDNQGHASGRRRANLPGPLGDWYWCVPKPFTMVLPAGEYDIAIRRGVEHIPIYDSISVEPGELAEKTYEPRRWVDMRKSGWYSGDDHVHCQILSDEDADKVMAWVQAEGIHVANIVKMGDIFRTWFEQRGFGPQYRVIEGDYVLSPGQECPRTHDEIGHTLAMNTKRMIRDTDKYFLYDWVADNVHAQGGLWGYAHINSGLFHVHRDMSINIPKGKCDFAEVLQFNSLGTGLYYDFLNAGFKITASAGSDVPWGGSVGEVRVYAHIGTQDFSPDAWFDAVKRGRTFVTNGPMIELQVDDAMPGDEILVDDNCTLRIQARAWGHPERSAPAKLEVVRHGDAIRSAESSDSTRAELSLDFELPSEFGCWISARATARDGTTAHTTPVYVVRRGLRFWKFDEVDKLIAKRRASLDEVEQIIGRAEAMVASDQAAAGWNNEQLAAQGTELRKRIEAARTIYADLMKTADRERAIRSGTE